MDKIAATLAINLGIFVWTVVISKLLSIVSGGGTSLVVKSLTIRQSARGTEDNLIELTGRREGLFAFLLTLIGLSPTTSLFVNRQESTCETAGLLGVAHRSFPLDRVAQVTSGSKVAFEYVLAAVLTGLVGAILLLASFATFDVVPIIGVPIVTAIFIALNLLMFYLNKRFYVGIFGQGGWPVLLAFKPNVIEGVELNLDRAMEIAAVIRKLVVDSRKDQGRPPLPSPSAVAQADPPAPSAARNSHSNTLLNQEHSAGPRSLLAEAQTLIRDSRRDDAIAVLLQVVRQFPGTAEAVQAKRSLEKAGISA